MKSGEFSHAGVSPTKPGWTEFTRKRAFFRHQLEIDSDQPLREVSGLSHAQNAQGLVGHDDPSGPSERLDDERFFTLY
ncbi:hypothetical protein OYT88_19930 [Sporolactobacillus sp. CQH2019]|uniref:hypothetical protein n=1 Tax=Sporolactobacillus sp. CQH2019 TaxID=3023512 RepID=UPI0023676829|nr:hypothetical protein [Sporolactobacillus sp. CQH2019]MDD9150792.1 hypothetical protein [Sporolactobacillus sp. CQH2019]